MHKKRLVCFRQITKWVYLYPLSRINATAPLTIRGANWPPLVARGGGCEALGGDKNKKFTAPRKRGAVNFLFVNASFQRAYVRDIPVILVVVKTVADNKFVGHITADIIRMNIHNSAIGLVKKGDY